MAVFNPQVKDTQDPNYLNYSRVLDAPTPDISRKLALETATTGLDSAVSITDTAIKKSIADTAYAKVDPLRDKMTTGLEQIKTDLDKGIIPKPAQTADGTTTGKSWLDANAMADPEDNLPVGLADSLAGVQALASAKSAGSPKLNDTKYAGDVLAAAKQMRAQYGPGYREYIDQKISEASGLPVANSYYQNMLVDINRQLTQMGRTKDDVYDSLKKSNDMPGQADLLLKYKANPNDPAIQSEALHRINDWENGKTQGSLDAADRARTDWKEKDLITKQTQSLGNQLNTLAQIHMSALQDASLPGGGTGKDLAQLLTDYAAGKHPEIGETEINQRRLQYNNWMAGIERDMAAKAAQYAPLIGDTTNIVKNAMAPLRAQQMFFNNKEDGPGHFITRQVEHIKADATNNILLSKDAGAVSAAIVGARAIYGEQYFPQAIGSIVSTNAAQKFQGLIEQEAIAAVSPYADKRGQKIPRYHIDAIKKGVEAGATGDDDYFGEKGVSKVISSIADPRMNLEAKDKLIDYAFNNKNVGRLNELKMDYTDPVTGEKVGGKYRMFNLLSSEAINKGVRETSLVHPENYQKYQNTLETEFGSLYRSTILDLNTALSGDVGLHFSFNDKTNQFGLVDKNNRPISEDPRITLGSRLPTQYPMSTYVQGIQDKLNLVNSAVVNMARVQENSPGDKKDTSKYLLQLLQTSGFRPGTNITGATEGMAKAIIQSKNPDMTPQQLDKLILGSRGPAARSNFTPEEDRSLATFLRSPAGQARGTPQPDPNLESYQTRNIIHGNLSDQPMGAPIRTNQ